MNNINLVRKVAWDFSKTTGIEFEELFGEASIAYTIAIQSYDKTKKTKLTTWATKVMKQHLTNFCKKQEADMKATCELDENIDMELSKTNENKTLHKMIFEEWKESLPTDLQTLCDIVFTKDNIIMKTPKATRGKIIKNLREEKGWTWARIWDSIRNMKVAINEI